MVLRFELNTTVTVFVPVTLHGTSNIVPYWVWILFVVVILYQWSATFFYHDAQITFSIAIEDPLHLKPLEQNESDTCNTQLPYNRPGGYFFHVLFSQFVFFPIYGPGRISGKTLTGWSAKIKVEKP